MTNIVSSWSKILFRVPPGPILGPLLFNFFIWNIFYFFEDFDIANYVDNSASYSADKNAKFVVSNQ